MAKKKLENMTEAELEKYIQERTAQRRELKAEQMEAQAQINALRAAAKVENMSDAERAALAQVLAPNGVPSGESVGTPGN